MRIHVFLCEKSPMKPTSCFQTLVAPPSVTSRWTKSHRLSSSDHEKNQIGEQGKGQAYGLRVGASEVEGSVEAGGLSGRIDNRI